MKVWLDDVRDPPDDTWVHCRSHEEFIDFMTCDDCLGPEGVKSISEMSLDHDLGADCERCYRTEEGSDVVAQTCDSSNYYMSGRPEDCRCLCHQTGYDVTCWMEKYGVWPPNRPRVHSLNPVGAERMRRVIDRYYDRDNRLLQTVGYPHGEE